MADHILILLLDEKKKSTINPKNEDDKCLQYAAAVALNYGETESHPKRVSNFKSYISYIF